MRPLRAILAALVLAGCVSSTPVLTPPTGPVPDLVGTWRGTWGGEPAALLITAQNADGAYAGVYVGDWQVLGPRRPAVSGVLSSTIRGALVSSRVTGWFGNDAAGRQVLVLAADGVDGLQRLTLTRVNATQLQGTGTSTFRWGPEGPAQFTRQPR
jgi:hypothetical protein